MLVKIGGVGAELADRVGVAIGRDADHVHVGMDVDSGGVGVDDMERRRRGGDGDGMATSDATWRASAGFLGLLGFFGSSGIGTTMDVSGSRVREVKAIRRRATRGVSGTIEVSPTGSIPRRGNPAWQVAKDKVEASRAMLPSGKKHQSRYGH